MSKTWFTSDLHFFHRNIVEYTNRGKETNKSDHDKWLINLWNETVNPEDTVYHLGDFAFHKSYEDLAGILAAVNAKQIIMLKGNHDEKSVLNRLVTDQWITEWHMYREIKIGDTKTVLHHFPISSWHQQGRGSYHLHGHCHGNLKEMFSQGLILDAGLDQYYNMYGKHGFFSEEQVIEIMKAKTKFISDHHADRE